MSLLSAKVSVSDESDFHYVINITVTKSGCHYFVQDCRNSPIIMANTLSNKVPPNGKSRGQRFESPIFLTLSKKEQRSNPENSEN